MAANAENKQLAVSDQGAGHPTVAPALPPSKLARGVQRQAEAEANKLAYLLASEAAKESAIAQLHHRAQAQLMSTVSTWNDLIRQLDNEISDEERTALISCRQHSFAATVEGLREAEDRIRRVVDNQVNSAVAMPDTEWRARSFRERVGDGWNRITESAQRARSDVIVVPYQTR